MEIVIEKGEEVINGKSEIRLAEVFTHVSLRCLLEDHIEKRLQQREIHQPKDDG
jgi:hypothetical protein